MQRETRVKDYIMPTRVLWETPGVLNSGALLEEKPFQTSFTGPSFCTVPYKGAILLDFGREMQGGVQILVQNCGKESKSRIRVRFGESAMEAMSQIGEKNSTNHHAPRDEEFDFSFFSNIEFGNTGFRFVRIDVTEDSWVQIRQVRAMYVHSGRQLEGSFSCSDPLLNKIWETGAYTVYQNMQDYLWDGIKRDRLVWIGDMHPETSTISAIYGYDDCVPKSLNLVRDETPADSWMNGLPTYSMWWIKIHHDWYMHNGDFAFLKEQESYLEKLVEHLISCVNDDGTNNITDKFIDWPSSTDPVAQEAGVHSMLVASLTAAQNIFNWCGNEAYAKKCAHTVSTLKKYVPSYNENKQAASLMVFSGLLDAKDVNEKTLRVNPTKGVSTFLGYYVLKARGEAADAEGAMDLIKEYWGAMLALGATSFWEDFNMDWVKGAKPIDSILEEGEYDVHGDNGGYCYEGFRHSLCHGWSSGPTAFLSEYVLGAKAVEPGCKTVKITPQLGSLTWVRGDYPTPYGNIHIEHQKQENGEIKTTVTTPAQVKVIY